MSRVRPSSKWTKDMEDILRKIIKDNNFVTWKMTYKHTIRLLEYETRKRNRRLVDIKTEVLGGCGQRVGTQITHYIEHDPHWPYPIKSQQRSDIPCMGSVVAQFKIYSNGDVEAEARCGACGRLHESKVTFGKTPSLWSDAMCSLRDDSYWKEYAQKYLEKNILEKKRVKEEKEEFRFKQEETKRKRSEAAKRRRAMKKLLQTPHPCPHCSSSKTYEKQDIIERTKAKVTCKKWRCRKEFIIQDIAALYDSTQHQ